MASKTRNDRNQEAGLVRVTLGIALFILVAGLWACLWVPPGF